MNFKNDGIKFYTAKINDENLLPYQNNEVIKLISNNYNNEFISAFIPEGYDICFLLISEETNNSFEDIWKILFFKKVMEMGSGTITLDNIDEMKEAGSKYEIYKDLDGSFEDVIQISCDLISKHKSLIGK